jgi:60 kDa SS-A/Ro ribonucleoprotein
MITSASTYWRVDRWEPVMPDALSSFAQTVTATPQTQPVPGRTDMIKSHSGGYVFEKVDWDKFRDFLVLGTEANTYYLGRDELTAQNAGTVIELAKSDGAEVVRIAVEMSTAIPVRVPKNRGCLFALAAVSALGDAEGVQAVKAALPQVARTTDHLSMFFGYRKLLKGKGTPRGRGVVSSRAFRSTLAAYLLAVDANDSAFRACKARQRKTPAGEALDLQDIVRIAHPATQAPEKVMLLRWLAGKATDAEAAEVLPAVENFMIAKAVTSPAEAIRVVTDRRVPWEFLPSEVLSSKEVWEALASTIGITALIRNLARMTRIGAIAPFSATNGAVVRRLTNAEAIRKGRIHPMDAYLALRVYASGTSQPNPKAERQHWTPVAEISDALEESYELAFGTVQPSGKRTIVAVDSSGSMSGMSVTLGGSPLGTPYEVGCAIATMLKRIDGESTHVIDVDTAVHSSKITKRTSFREISSWCPSGGGTDLALPMQYAMRESIIVDGFTLLTDNATWAGVGHPFQALDQYRKGFSPHARFADVTMVPYGTSVADPQAAGVLNIAGMDASLPTVLSGFFRGE